MGIRAWAASRDASLANTLIREVYDRPGKPSAVELYDLQQDLVEFHNLAGKPEYAEVEMSLKAWLQAWGTSKREIRYWTWQSLQH